MLVFIQLLETIRYNRTMTRPLLQDSSHLCPSPTLALHKLPPNDSKSTTAMGIFHPSFSPLCNLHLILLPGISSTTASLASALIWYPTILSTIPTLTILSPLSLLLHILHTPNNRSSSPNCKKNSNCTRNCPENTNQIFPREMILLMSYRFEWNVRMRKL